MRLRVIFTLCVLSLVTSAFAGVKEFNQGKLFLTPQFAYYSYAPNLGVSVEYAVTDNIGIGGSCMFAFWSDDFINAKISQTLITPSVEGYYHFTNIQAEKLDLFAGLSIGYSIFSWKWKYGDSTWSDAGSSGIYLSPILGARYYLAKNLIFCFKTHYSALGSWSGIGGEFGLTFLLSK
ncbi:MAG TPA: hypothetical protein VK186_22380 [Candidatus Deferrimicrobium sp.]|nr:hypothetical protein [Candidatus Deferrimicrobium sp.]